MTTRRIDSAMTFGLSLGALMLPACFNPSPVDQTGTEQSGSGDSGVMMSTTTADGTGTSGMADDTETTNADTDTGMESECGNGIVEGVEQCDLGADNSDDAECTTACELARCGDGLVFVGEEDCDDGSNGDPDDGCTDECTIPTCGDGYVQPSLGEACDGDDLGGLTCEGLGWSGGRLTCVDCQPDESGCMGCGDGVVEPGESCDDGNEVSGDGCEPDCSFSEGVAEISSQWYATCARFFDGRLRCWGYNIYGQLGYGQTSPIGDDETAASAGDVSLGADVLSPSTGTNYTCAVVVDGTIRCWGGALDGRLGYGNTTIDIGDDELPSEAFSMFPDDGAVNLGGPATQVVLGRAHTCALMDDGSVRCWGDGDLGKTGYGNTTDIGDNELPLAAGTVSMGGTVTQLAAGWHHTCALMDSGGVRCWGQGSNGQLGYGNTENIGDDEVPSAAGDIALTNDGSEPVQLSAGQHHTCALFDTGTIKCWGYGFQGRLGYGNTDTIGDDETPDTVGYVDVGGTAIQIAVGHEHTCALLDTGSLRCWGPGNSGRLGYGNTFTIGDDETPASAGDVNIGGTVIQVATGNLFTCALLDNRQVRCFGDSAFGQLGHGNMTDIGDDEFPASAGDVPLWP